MKVDLSLIEEYIGILNSELDDTRLLLEKCKTDVNNLKINLKETDLQLNDHKKILSSISDKQNSTEAAFSPYFKESENKQHEIEVTEKINQILREKNIINLKLETKVLEQNNYENKLNDIVDNLVKLDGIKQIIKKQVDEYNAEYYIIQLKEIVQKKRLIELEKSKYNGIINKINFDIKNPIQEQVSQMKLILDFIQTDPLRAKQELEKLYNNSSNLLMATNKLIDTYLFNQKEQPLCDSLNSYVGQIINIYSNVEFKVSVSNLKSINNINIDLNRCIMDLFKGLINTFILKCNPKAIGMRLVYEDGYLNITGNIIGKYINFYNEMKTYPTSMIARVYEKAFLLNGNINFKNKKDGTFSVVIKIPIKNYFA